MNRILARAAVGVLVLSVSVTMSPLLVAQDATAPAGTAPTAPAQQSTQAAPATQQGTQPAPDSQQTPSNPNNLPPVEMPENPGQNNSTNQQNLPSAPKQQGPAQPNGTAVAPPIELSGGAASKPAGVAIAPPKQRQIRSLLIKLGFLAGAGIAIGTVVGLSAASPGHVPNSPGH